MSDKPRLAEGAIGSFAGRVGHKAGGFISKKFFHPSNYKNQEKLWAAIEAQKDQEKRQEELMKKREEERRVEVLKMEMQSATAQSKGSSGSNVPVGGLFSSLSAGVKVDQEQTIPVHEQRAISETKKRLALLKDEKAGAGSSTRLIVKSRYEEDVHEKGHSEIWGSHLDLDTKQWGYACCRTLVRGEGCPLAGSSPKRRKH